MFSMKRIVMMSTTKPMLIIFLVFVMVRHSIEQDTLVDMARDFESNIRNTQIPDTKKFKKEYDFVIIGAGSAGAVAANRLSEIPNVTILLLEAGDQETFLSDVPLTAALTSTTRYNWGYKTEPTPNACRRLKYGVCNWPKGKGIGGTSLINYMLYNRGHQKDYDHWASLGNVGWNYENVLPYFKKSENIQIPELKYSQYHGTHGPMNVEWPPYKTKMLNAFLRAGREMNFNVTDPNGANLIGFSQVQANIKDGRRCSTSKAFIHPIRFRKNLYISMKSWVTKILINPESRQAVGVKFLKQKKNHYVRAKKEVILCAGAVASPQLLMLSGIGPKANLKKLGIPIFQNLKVGYNLQDHVSLPPFTFLVNQPVTIIENELRNPIDVFQYIFRRTGPLTIPGGAEGYAFIRTPNATVDHDFPNVEIVLGAGSLNNDATGTMRELLGITEEFYQKVYKNVINKHAFGMVPVLLHPKSRGRISLKSKNPFHWPKMEPNYMHFEEDINAMVEGIQFIMKLTETKAMQKYGTRIHKTPYLGCENETFGSTPYWKCCLRLYANSLQHQVGTCKMGPDYDKNAVVDPQLKVYGIDKLRVIDASIMPTIPAGHTNAIVIMIAEKGSDMIKQYWEL